MQPSQINFGSNMKCKILSSILGLALVQGAAAQTSQFFLNDGILTTPPQVDAVNFVNNNTMSLFSLFDLFESANTLNYTNRGLLDSSGGWRFDTFSTQSGTRRMASSFVNQVGGVINSGVFGLGIVIPPFGLQLGGVGGIVLLQPPRFLVSATNIVNRGSIDVDAGGVATLKGRNVDLSRGLINVANFTTLTGVGNIYDGLWGVGQTDDTIPALHFGAQPFSPPHEVTNRFYVRGQQIVSLANPTTYVSDVFTGPSNRVVQVAFIQNTNTAMTNFVYFFNGNIVTEWVWLQTNILTDAVVTNHMFLVDAYGAVTNNVVKTNGIAALATGLRPSFAPTNFTFSFFNFFGGIPATPGSTGGVFPPGNVTNQYASYRAIFSPSDAILAETAGQAFSNLAGRVEIEATHTLDLNRARIFSVNSLLMKATNHFAGSSRARVAAPFVSADLRTTNGFLSVSNLVAPSVPRLEGYVDCFSARWTNIDAFNFTNIFHVTLVDSRLATYSPVQFHGLSLKTDDLRIHDVLNLVSNAVLDAERITIASNAPGSLNSSGQLNLLRGDVYWPSYTPRLNYLTNDGVIQSFNAIFFGGGRSTPFFSSNFTTNYEAFVNRGTISDQGSLIWSKHFENHGTFFNGSGAFFLDRNQTASMTNGLIFSPFGDVTINSGNLTMSNVNLTAGLALTLAVTNTLTDSGNTNGNIWNVGDGFNLLVKPAAGDLLGTTLYSAAPQFAEVFNRWAGADLGRSRAGFQNNGAIGRLILDGGTDSQHTFTGIGVSNAIYIDHLEIRNYITNRSISGDYIGMQIDPNMIVYFAEATQDGVSVASKLDGQNGGRLRWVSDYAGDFSFVDVIYPDGSTNRLNAALVNSDLDSDCDNEQNSLDNTPLLLITTASLPDATNGTAYATPLQAFGGPNSAVQSWTALTSLPAGLSLSPAGIISGTPTQIGTNSFTARVSINTPCGVLTADRTLPLVVQPQALTLSLAVVYNAAPGAKISWNTGANAQNHVYYRNSMLTGNWQILTNFVSPTGGTVTVTDTLGTNKARYYRVQVSTP
jgi:hypothetical protein